MVSFFLDASALAKRYVPEIGSALVDFLFDHVAEHRIYMLNVGCAEVVSVLVRKKNAGTLSAAQFSQALRVFDREVIQSSAKHLLAVDNSVVTNSLVLIVKHSINANDAMILRVSIDVRKHLRSGADDLALVASDQRLLRAAQAEGLLTFNPETQDQASLAALAGS